MSASSAIAAPTQRHFVLPADPSKPSSSPEMGQTIRAINALVLGKTQFLYPWKHKDFPFVALSERHMASLGEFRRIVAAQDVVFVPIGTSEAQILLSELGFSIHQIAGESSMIALNPKTWAPGAKLVKNTEFTVTPGGITILASQKDGRSVMLACYKSEDEKAFATPMEWLHAKYQSINTGGGEVRFPHGWTHVIAAFHVEQPLSEKSVPPDNHWFARKDLNLAGEILGSNQILHENPRLNGLMQKKITWPCYTNDAEDDIYD